MGALTDVLNDVKAADPESGGTIETALNAYQPVHDQLRLSTSSVDTVRLLLYREVLS
jgi:hypothetical protein